MHTDEYTLRRVLVGFEDRDWFIIGLECASGMTINIKQVKRGAELSERIVMWYLLHFAAQFRLGQSSLFVMTAFKIIL